MIDAISASVTEHRPYDIQHRIVRRDGSVRTVHGQGEVTFESDGTPSHIWGTVLDITDRAEAERTIAESEERLRAIVDTVRSGIVITDEQGAIRFTNRACEEMFGYSPGELMRLNADVMIPESEREHATARSAAMLRGEEVQSRFRAQRVRKDGSAIYVDVGTSVVSLPGEPDGILVELRDVTEEVQLQAQLLQVQKSEALGTLVAGVAHDFNNLLTSILGGIELARRRPDQAERWLVKAQRAAERSAQLVQQLVTFSRPSQYDTAPIDTTETVREAVAMARDTFDRRIQISFEAVEELPPVLGNHGELVQVVMNLLLNARDAVSERLEKGDDERYDPMIGITVDAAPGSGAIATHVRLVVQDNGVGMSEDVRARAFDPYFSTKEIGKGTGLGLAIVYRIIRDHGGSLELRSVLGGGTTFSIRLPATRREGTEGEQGGEPDERWLGRDRVLLVLDDDPTVLERVDVALMGVGCDVVVTSDVREALGVAQERSFDLLILDLNMSTMSGWQAFDRFREIDPGCPSSSPPAVALPQRPASEARRACCPSRIRQTSWCKR